MQFKIHVPFQPNVRSGVYMGGIGSGGFEVRPDGRFYHCHIFNEWHPSPMLDAFFVHHNGTDIRGLMATDLLPSGERLNGVNDIEYTGEFPFVTLRYPSRGVEISFTSFFSPGDVCNSSIPAVLMRVKGKGKLQFVIHSKYEAYPEMGKHSAVLKSNKGELGLYAQKAKPSACGEGDRWVVVTGLETGYQHPVKPVERDRPQKCCATLNWEGEFDDEVVMAWHYPGFCDNQGTPIGIQYDNFYKSASDVAAYVAKHKAKLLKNSRAFHTSVYNADMPEYVKQSYGAQISTFVKQSWHAGDGRFGVWEGSCSCCGVQTTDVSYYGSWLYASMFPELERSGMALTAQFQRAEDGWIPHLFPGTFDKIDCYTRKDMNMQYVLLTFRDYTLWNDKGFLREHYPNIKKAIEGAYRWDTNGDMIPEVEPAAQTFDAWGFSGTSTFIASLWVACLQAGAGAARAMGDKHSAQKWAADAEIAAQSAVKKLWNGSYFILCIDGKKRDDGCMLDALSGDWYSRLLGLGGVFDDTIVRSHLKSCIKYCRVKMDVLRMPAYSTPGEEGYGYINAGYSDGRRICFQQYEPWTGIEFAFAVHLYLVGMKKQALQVVKDVHDRKARCGMVWNHIECGGDYFRPMVIGALWNLLARDRIPTKR